MNIWIEVDKCDGCKLCAKACPYDAIEIVDKIATILDHCPLCGACIEVCKNEAIKTDAQPRVVPDFSDRKGVWVFAEQRSGRLERVSLELLGIAGELAGSLGEKVTAVLPGYEVGGLCETLIHHGADRVFLADDKMLENYRTIAYTDVIEKLVMEHKPNIFLMGATHIGRDLAPRVSRRVGSGLTADCTELTIDPEKKILLQTRPAFGGNVMATIANRYSRPQMATVRPGVMEIVPKLDNKGEVIDCEVELSEKWIGTQILKIVKEKKAGTDITQAKIIVAGGRGVNGAKGFKMLNELAEALGAEMAGTRIVVEEGLVPVGNQVGQTGKTVRPEIYIACGVSGAIQHRAGMMNSRYIIAVNNDPRAPIFKISDWGIVADLHEIVPEMIRQLRRSA